MKTCNCCKTQKPLSEFYLHKSYADGHRSECKSCLKSKAATPEARARNLAYMKKWQADHPEKTKEYHRITHLRHNQVRNEKNRKWRAENKSRHKELVAEWRKKNPEANSVYVNRRRCRKSGNGGSHTVKEWRGLLEYFNHSCAYCLRHESECGKLTRDHFVPLKDGGTDNIDNIFPACRDCNSKKNAKPFLKFFFEGGSKCRSIISP